MSFWKQLCFTLIPSIHPSDVSAIKKIWSELDHWHCITIHKSANTISMRHFIGNLTLPWVFFSFPLPFPLSCTQICTLMESRCSMNYPWAGWTWTRFQLLENISEEQLKLWGGVEYYRLLSVQHCSFDVFYLSQCEKTLCRITQNLNGMDYNSTVYTMAYQCPSLNNKGEAQGTTGITGVLSARACSPW